MKERSKTTTKRIQELELKINKVITTLPRSVISEKVLNSITRKMITCIKVRYNLNSMALFQIQTEGVVKRDSRESNVVKGTLIGSVTRNWRKRNALIAIAKFSKKKTALGLTLYDDNCICC